MWSVFLLLLPLLSHAAAPTRTLQPYAEADLCASAGVIFCEDFNFSANITCTGDGGLITWNNPANTNTDNQFQAPAGSCSGVSIAPATNYPAKPTGALPSGAQADQVLVQDSTIDTRNGLWLFLRQLAADTYANGDAALTDWYARFQIYWTPDWTWSGDPKNDWYDYGASGVDQKTLFFYPPQVRDVCAPTDCSYDAGMGFFVSNWDGTRRYADGLQFRIGSGGGSNYATFPNDYASGNPNPHLEYRPFQCATDTADCWRDPDDQLIEGQLFRFNTGQWYTVEMRYALSTVNTSNGTVSVWVNGTLLYSETDLRTCTSGSETPDCSGLGALYLSHYHNSSDTTTFAGQQVVDNLVISSAPIGLPAAAGGDTYYVNGATGDDSRSCGTAQNSATPRDTITAGIACLSGGDTLEIAAGTYAEFINNTIPSGSVGAPTILQAADGASVILRHTTSNRALRISGRSYITVDGLTFDGTDSTGGEGIVLDESTPAVTNILLQNLTVQNFPFGNSCINVKHGVTNSTIQDSEIAFCGQDGDPSPGRHGLYTHGSDNTYQRLTIHDTSGNGIQNYSSRGDTISNAIIRNNRIYNIDNVERGASGLWLGCTNVGQQAYNNLVYNSYQNRVCGETLLANNTFYNLSGRGVVHTSSATAPPVSVTISNNIFASVADTSFVPAGNLLANPLFVSASTGDFHLLAGSPAIDTAATIAAVTDDFDGTARPVGSAYDYGAYEYPTSSVGIPFTTAWAITDTTTIVITVNPSGGTMTLNGGGCTGFTVTENGSPFALTSCVQTNNTTLTLTTTGSMSGDNSYVFTWAPATGNWTNGTSEVVSITKALTNPLSPVETTTSQYAVLLHQVVDGVAIGSDRLHWRGNELSAVPMPLMPGAQLALLFGVAVTVDNRAAGALEVRCQDTLVATGLGSVYEPGSAFGGNLLRLAATPATLTSIASDPFTTTVADTTYDGTQSYLVPQGVEAPVVAHPAGTRFSVGAAIEINPMAASGDTTACWVTDAAGSDIDAYTPAKGTALLSVDPREGCQC